MCGHLTAPPGFPGTTGNHRVSWLEGTVDSPLVLPTPKWAPQPMSLGPRQVTSLSLTGAVLKQWVKQSENGLLLTLSPEASVDGWSQPKPSLLG